MNSEQIYVILFYGLLVVLGIFYAFAAVRRQKEVAEKLSKKPDLNKKHSIFETIILPKSTTEVWPYLTQAELYKQWHPHLKEIVSVGGELFTVQSSMTFRYSENIDLSIQVIAREENQYIGFRKNENRFDRYEWFILEALGSTSTKLSVVADHQFRSSGRKGDGILWLQISTKAHIASIQNDLKKLQEILG